MYPNNFHPPNPYFNPNYGYQPTTVAPNNGVYASNVANRGQFKPSINWNYGQHPNRGQGQFNPHFSPSYGQPPNVIAPVHGVNHGQFNPNFNWNYGLQLTQIYPIHGAQASNGVNHGQFNPQNPHFHFSRVHQTDQHNAAGTYGMTPQGGIAPSQQQALAQESEAQNVQTQLQAHEALAPKLAEHFEARLQALQAAVMAEREAQGAPRGRGRGSGIGHGRGRGRGGVRGRGAHGRTTRDDSRARSPLAPHNSGRIQRQRRRNRDRRANRRIRDEEHPDAEERAASSHAEILVEQAAADDLVGGHIQPPVQTSAPAEIPADPQNPAQSGTTVSQINATAPAQPINNTVNVHVQLPSGGQFVPGPHFLNAQPGQNLHYQNPGFGHDMPQHSGSVQHTPQPNAGLLPNTTPSNAVVQGMPHAGLPLAPINAGEIVRNATQGATDGVLNGIMKIMGSVLNTVAGNTSNEAANVRISNHHAIDNLGPASITALTEREEQVLEGERMNDAGSLVPTRHLASPTRRLLMPPVDRAWAETAGRVTSTSEDVDSDISDLVNRLSWLSLRPRPHF